MTVLLLLPLLLLMMIWDRAVGRPLHWTADLAGIRILIVKIITMALAGGQWGKAAAVRSTGRDAGDACHRSSA